MWSVWSSHSTDTVYHRYQTQDLISFLLSGSCLVVPASLATLLETPALLLVQNAYTKISQPITWRQLIFTSGWRESVISVTARGSSVQKPLISHHSLQTWCTEKHVKMFKVKTWCRLLMLFFYNNILSFFLSVFWLSFLLWNMFPVTELNLCDFFSILHFCKAVWAAFYPGYIKNTYYYWICTHTRTTFLSQLPFHKNAQNQPEFDVVGFRWNAALMPSNKLHFYFNCK